MRESKQGPRLRNMENTQRRFPATEALHGGEYLDKTLAQFEERIPADPDYSTKFEGTIYRLPAESDGMLEPQKRINTTSRAPATSEPKAVSLAPQSKLARAAKLWWKSLPVRVKREYGTRYGFSI